MAHGIDDDHLDNATVMYSREKAGVSTVRTFRSPQSPFIDTRQTW